MDKKIKVPEIFGENVFDGRTMQERLPKKIYNELQKTIENGTDLGQSCGGNRGS